jgi:hypothetical protein
MFKVVFKVILNILLLFIGAVACNHAEGSKYMGSEFQHHQQVHGGTFDLNVYLSLQAEAMKAGEAQTVEISSHNRQANFMVQLKSSDNNIINTNSNECKIEPSTLRCFVKIHAKSSGQAKIWAENDKVILDSEIKTIRVSGPWMLIGNELFTSAGVDNQKLAIGPNNTRYIAFKDFSSSPAGKITVMYNNDARSEWQILGKAGFSVGKVDNIGIVSDINGRLYVTYNDVGLNGKAVVMYYNGEIKEWQMLGGKPLSPQEADSISIAINPINDQIYVAYSDYSNGQDGSAKVVKFEGTDNRWVNVGSKEYIMNNKVTDNSLVFDKQGKLYLAFSDKGFAMGRAAVMSYNSTNNNWGYLGASALSRGEAGSITLAVAPNNTLYLASNMLIGGFGVQVLYYDTKLANWGAVGDGPVSESFSENVSFSISANNKLYIAYRNPVDGGYADVVIFDDKTQGWLPVGTSAHVYNGRVNSDSFLTKIKI